MCWNSFAQQLFNSIIITTFAIQFLSYRISNWLHSSMNFIIIYFVIIHYLLLYHPSRDDSISKLIISIECNALFAWYSLIALAKGRWWESASLLLTCKIDMTFKPNGQRKHLKINEFDLNPRIYCLNGKERHKKRKKEKTNQKRSDRGIEN